jgi:hypothetical protein
MQQANGSMRNRDVLRSNIPVGFIHSVDTSFTHFHILAYSVDDGYGGKVHVNVGFIILSLAWLH